MKPLQMPILITLLFALVMGCAPDISDVEHIANAQRYISSGDDPAAIIELKNALQKNPQNAQARTLLGESYLEYGDYTSAEKELTSALELATDANIVAPALVRSYLGQNKLDLVKNYPLEGIDGPGAASILTSKATAEIRSGNLFSAGELLGQALSADSQSLEVRVAQARLQVAEKNPAEAIVTLEQVLETNPVYAPALKVRGSLAHTQGDLTTAESFYTQAIASTLNNSGVRLSRAFTRIQLSKLDQAKEDIDVLNQTIPDNAAVKYAEGIYHYAKGDAQQAANALGEALGVAESYPKLHFYLASANALLDNLEQAEKYARLFYAADDTDKEGRKLLANILLRRGQFEEIETLLKPVIESDQKDSKALQILAGALSQTSGSEFGSPVDVLAQVVELEPDSAEALTSYGLALIQEGNSKLGLEKLQQALLMDPRYQRADILLIINYLQMDDMGKAVAAAKDFVARNPDDPVALTFLGRVYLAAEQTDNAINSFQSALGLFPGDPTASRSLAYLAAQTGDIDKARSLLKTVLKHNQDHLGTLVTLALLEGNNGNLADVKTYLEQATSAHPDANGPRLMLSRYYLLAGNPSAALVSISQLNTEAAKTIQALEVKALAQVRLQEYKAAATTLSDIVGRYPQNTAAHYALAVTYATLEQIPQMLESLEKITELEPKHIGAHIMMAKYAALANNTSDLSKELEVLGEVAPDNADVLSLQASEAIMSGNNALALEKFQLAFEASPGASRFIDIAKQHFRMGNSDTSREMLDKWLSTNPEDLKVRRFYASFLQRMGQLQEANTQYLQVLKYDKNSVSALNNLAWNLKDSDSKKALEYAEKARSIGGENPEILDTLAMVYLAVGDRLRASRSISRAVNLGDNPSIRYHQLLIDHDSTNTTETRAELQKLLDQHEGFPERDKAVDFLDTLTEG